MNSMNFNNKQVDLNNMQVNLAAQGSTGFTFLCEPKIKKLEHVILDTKTEMVEGKQNEYCVFKWIKKNDIVEEGLCNDIFSHYELKVPSVNIIENKEARKFGSQTIKTVQVLSCYEDLTTDFSLMWMKRVKGQTVREIPNGIVDLNENDLAKVGEELGKITIFDLVIGNLDRLFRLDKGGDMSLVEDPEANTGNIMVDIDKENNLTDIVFIDNDTFFKGNQKISGKVSPDENDDILGGLFLEEEIIFSPIEEADFDTFDTKDSEEILLDIPKSDVKEKYHKNLKLLINNFSLLNKHITESICKAVKKDFYEKNNNQPIKQESIERFCKIIEKNIPNGFEKAINQIKVVNLDEYIENKVKNNKELENHEFLNFIRKNIDLIKNSFIDDIKDDEDSSENNKELVESIDSSVGQEKKLVL